MIKDSNILITGGHGFIGAHLAKHLGEDSLNNRIVILDLHTTGRTTGIDLDINSLKSVTTVNGSLLNEADLNKLPNDFDYIIHAAGFLGIDKVAEMQLETMKLNIDGTHNCLNLAARQKKKPFVLIFSTSEIYGIHSDKAIESDDAIIPTQGKRWCYAASKLAAEYYLKAYIQEYSIKGAIVRPFNVFGPYRHGSNAMTKIISLAIENKPISISGDGKQVRAWCYIDDFCQGITSILKNSTGTGDAYNLGDPRNQISMLDLAKLITSLLGSNSKIIISNSTIEDVLFRVPDISKAVNLLGYKPKVVFNNAIMNVAKLLKKES